MKGFLKENKGFLASILLSAATLAMLQFVSCEKSNDLEETLEEVENLRDDLAAANKARGGFEGVEDNLELARKDNSMLLEERTKELKNWNLGVWQNLADFGFWNPARRAPVQEDRCGGFNRSAHSAGPKD